MIRFCSVLALVLGGLAGVSAQEQTIEIDGQYFPIMVDECGDTIVLATLSDVSVSAFQGLDSDDRKRYRMYRAYAADVYPYAVEAIRIFRKLEDETSEMKKRKRKKFTKELHKELKEEFTDPLKKLTKTQGKILIKMIEKELDTPLFELIKNLRNGLTAQYWSILGSLFGHEIKDGYIPGQDPILDAVLNDMDISYSSMN